MQRGTRRRQAVGSTRQNDQGEIISDVVGVKVVLVPWVLDFLDFRYVKCEPTVIFAGALGMPRLHAGNVRHLGVAAKVVPAQSDAIVALGGALTIEAVGGRQDDVGGDEGAAADVGVVRQCALPGDDLLERHHVRIARGGGGLAADDPGRREAQGGLTICWRW